jgi:xylan 1,4-beta-xylosidase
MRRLALNSAAVTLLLTAQALVVPSALAAPAEAPLTASFPVQISVEANRSIGEFKPIWRFFGADEPNYATMKDGQRLMEEIGALRPGAVYFRAHNLLTSGDGTPALKWGSTNAYTEDALGRPVYDWTILDRIFDTYLASGVRPYVEVGFMPEALSVRPRPYQHQWRPGHGDIGTGWAYPPTDYGKWSELVYQWAKHCVERYGEAEVSQWYWETWNEANGSSYWHASPEEFYKLHDYAVTAIRRALPSARVGGPDCAGSGGPFMVHFLDHCLNGTNYATGRHGTPVDFIAFHAKGRPEYVDKHVRMGIAAQLKDMEQGFDLVAAVPQLKDKPIVIGESDPDGCAACVGPQLGYRPSSLYASYTTACLAREQDLADLRGANLEGALTWAFEFEDQPFFAGQRVLASAGIDLPVLNAFRMFSRMDHTRVQAISSGQVALAEIVERGVRERPDVGVVATTGPGRLDILVWHYHDDDVPGPDADVELRVGGLPTSAAVQLRHFRIDEDHSNAFAAWRRMGSPSAPDAAQYAALRRAGELTPLAEASIAVTAPDGKANLHFALPRQAVSLLEFRWPVAVSAPPAPVLAPAVLPGRGLEDHDFFYAGEWDTRRPVQTMFIVRQGSVAWRYSIPNDDSRGVLQELDDATLLPDGNIVFARKTGAGIVTPDKKITWSYDAPPGFEVHVAQPAGADRVMIVQNGNPATLRIINTATGITEKIFELPVGNPKSAHGQFRSVRITPAGTFLAAHMDADLVAEYDGTGRRLWSLAVPSPWAALRLTNGNTLVSSNHAFVREYDRHGSQVWEYDQKDAAAAGVALFVCQGISRLPDGNTIITNWCPGQLKDRGRWPSSVQALEVTPDKRIIWALRSWTQPADLGPATTVQILDGK